MTVAVSSQFSIAMEIYGEIAKLSSAKKLTLCSSHFKFQCITLSKNKKILCEYYYFK